MTSYTILDQTFDLSDEARGALEKYIIRIEDALKKHGQDSNAREDLLLRIREKLERSVQDQPTVKLDTILRIMSEIGEPEEIFQYARTDPKPSGGTNITKDDVKDFFRREFHRNQKSGIILGVCAGLAETFEINPFWIRILFVVCTIAWGSGVIVYLVLAILLPDASRWGEQTNAEKSENTVERQANECVEDIKSRTNTYTSRSGAFAGFFQAIGAILSTLGEMIGILVRFWFFGLIAVVLSAGAIGLIISGAIMSSRLVIDMQDIFAYVPEYTGWIIAMAGIASIVLAGISIGKAFGKKIGNNWIILGCIVILGGALFAGVRSAAMIAPHYANEYSSAQSKTFMVASGSIVEIEESYRGSNSRFRLENSRPWVSFERSADSTLRIEQRNSIRAGSKEEGEKILAVIRPIETAYTGGILRMVRPEGSSFSSTIPFPFLERSIIVFVPDEVSIRLPEWSRYSVWHENILPSDPVRILRYGDCSGLVARYDSTIHAFTCDDPSLSIEHSIIWVWRGFGYDDDSAASVELRADHVVTSSDPNFPYVHWSTEADELVVSRQDGTMDRFSIHRIGDGRLSLSIDEEELEYVRSRSR